MNKIEFLNKICNRYEYEYLIEDSDIINYKSSIKLKCKKHGIIEMRASVLISGSMCRKCSDEKRSNKSIILSRFIEKYGDEYEYDISNYKNNSSKIKITCKKHGDFYTSSISHLEGVKCNMCNKENYIITDDEIIKRTRKYIESCKLVYGDKYDYSKVKYIRSDKKIIIICRKHGEFQVRASNHLYSNCECRRCRFDKWSNSFCLTTEEFVNSVSKIHGNFYNYSKVEYINSKTKVEIICPKHGSFFQRPHDHKNNAAGCPDCNFSHGEKLISNILDELSIKYTTQKSFEDCLHINLLSFDFYLDNLNKIIEYDGVQHYEPIEIFGGVKSFNIRKVRDNIKNEYCIKNNIPILRIPYFNIDNMRENIIIFLMDQTQNH